MSELDIALKELSKKHDYSYVLVKDIATSVLRLGVEKYMTLVVEICELLIRERRANDRQEEDNNVD